MKIAVWPDGTWCELKDVEREMSHMSDDYCVHYAASEQMADRIAEEVARGRK